jgi:hypothetical protein
LLSFVFLPSSILLAFYFVPCSFLPFLSFSILPSFVLSLFALQSSCFFVPKLFPFFLSLGSAGSRCSLLEFC